MALGVNLHDCGCTVVEKVFHCFWDVATVYLRCLVRVAHCLLTVSNVYLQCLVRLFIGFRLFRLFIYSVW